jgi:hypothetical protein
MQFGDVPNAGGNKPSLIMSAVGGDLNVVLQCLPNSVPTITLSQRSQTQLQVGEYAHSRR